MEKPHLPPGVFVLPDPAAVARRGAEEMVLAAQRSVAERGTFIVALSGGSTPKAMYELLAQNEQLHAAFPWWQTHWFWGDERNVPGDSPDSNYRMAYEALLSRSPAPPANIHRVPTELGDPAAIASAYQSELLTTFEQLGRGLEPYPAFDLLLLGMGTDGHTASLFPGTSALQVQDRTFVENRVEKMNTWRYTVTPPVLVAAERVVLLICGEDKSAVLREVLLGDYNPQQHPVQLLTRRTKPTLWLFDEPAARNLQNR